MRCGGWDRDGRFFVEAQRHFAYHYPESRFSDAASALVEAERMAQFEEEDVHFESNYFRTFDCLPLAEDAARAERFLYEAPPLFFARTEGSTPFRFSLHVGHVGHTLVVGPTGAGKSVLLALMALQFRRYAGSQIFAFDFGGSIRAAALAMAATGMISAALSPAMRSNPWLCNPWL